MSTPIKFNINFQCKCGETDKFLLKGTRNPYRLKILCLICEKEYIVEIVSKEIISWQDNLPRQFRTR
jgi:hypothetical protein